jgi:SAM-dependent methyltransferase
MQVTRDDVRYMYRLFLDREPESEDVIEPHLAATSLQELRAGFLASPECQIKTSASTDVSTQAAQTAQRSYFSTQRASNRIEFEATDAQLVKCLGVVSKHWSSLGSTTPHFSVLTDPRFLPDKLQANQADFWKSGEIESIGVIATLARHGVTDCTKLTGLDYGCGVGRVTLPLSKRFAQMHGYDISAPHLAVAAQAASNMPREAQNLHFHRAGASTLLKSVGRHAPQGVLGFLQRSTDADAADIVKADAIYCRLVLQHNPPPVMMLIVRCLLNALKPNGIAILQLPTYCWGYSYSVNAWLNRTASTGDALNLEMHCLPQRAVFSAAAQAQCEVVEVTEDDSTGSPHFLSNTFVIQRV